MSEPTKPSNMRQREYSPRSYLQEKVDILDTSNDLCI